MKNLSTVFFIGGSILAPFTVGICLTVLMMIKSFRALSVQGISDPAALAHGVGVALIAALAGIIVSAFSAVAWLAYFMIKARHGAGDKQGMLKR
jgi:biopolymer transport protein ExbB/TolQ